MTHKEVEEFILSMPSSRLDYPFGKDVAVYKTYVPEKSIVTHVDRVQGSAEEAERIVQKSTQSKHRKQATQQSATSAVGVGGSASKQDSTMRGDWKMFALIQEGKEPVRISLKCDPLLAETLRQKYDTVMPGYHLNKKHWNTIVLSGQLGFDEIKDLICHSYELVTGN